jgi:hypothetical protein
MASIVLTIIAILLAAVVRRLSACLVRAWKAMPVLTAMPRPRLKALIASWFAWCARMRARAPLRHVRRALVAAPQRYSAP